jgi:hypothetical protein
MDIFLKEIVDINLWIGDTREEEWVGTETSDGFFYSPIGCCTSNPRWFFVSHPEQ